MTDWREAGYEVEIPIGGARLSFPGQVLGCNYSGDDDSIGHYLFLGSGDFHPIGLVLHTGKPLAMLDPYTGDAEEMSLERIERILRQRFWTDHGFRESSTLWYPHWRKAWTDASEFRSTNEAHARETR